MSEDKLRILTLNTHKGFSSFNSRFILHELRDAIRSVGADLVFLQEVLGENKKHSEKVDNWPDEPQHEFLADSIWSDFAYAKNAIYTHGHHGNAILSKLPIENSLQKDVSVYALEQRGILHCMISLPGMQKIHCVCVHLGLFSRHRRQQLEMIADHIEETTTKDEPLIIAGDFNDWLENLDRDFKSRLKLEEVHQALYGRYAKTFPVRLPFLALDRIYFRGLAINTVEILDCSPWNSLSDHAGLMAEVSI